MDDGGDVGRTVTNVTRRLNTESSRRDAGDESCKHKRRCERGAVRLNRRLRKENSGRERARERGKIERETREREREREREMRARGRERETCTGERETCTREKERERERERETKATEIYERERRFTVAIMETSIGCDQERSRHLKRSERVIAIVSAWVLVRLVTIPNSMNSVACLVES